MHVDITFIGGTLKKIANYRLGSCARCQKELMEVELWMLIRKRLQAQAAAR
ncbi:hypothetical protein ABIA24_004405 [Sinorhizobium fredii]